MTGDLEVVFLDIGGVMYSDEPYKLALFRAIRELGSPVESDWFEEAYRACRAEQNGSFRRRLTHKFLGPEADPDEVQAIASRYWSYPPGSMFDDVPACLDALAAEGYRLGVIANQQSTIRDAMRRDGIDEYIRIWAVSDDLGLEKPDPRLYARAIEQAEVEPRQAAMVGDRLDYDVMPAKRAGMRTVWVLRGEAPDEPTAEQLAEPDAYVRDLAELPGALEGS